MQRSKKREGKKNRRHTHVASVFDWSMRASEPNASETEAIGERTIEALWSFGRS